jgi:tRNA(Ile)-lysidine synthase
MMTLTEKVYQEFLKKIELIEDFQAQTYLIAVSGGVDSMVLAHLFLKASLHFQIAHVNYQLRQEDSLKDEEIVTEFCLNNTIPIHNYKIDTLDYCQKNKLGIQEAARIIRYDWFKKIQKEQGLKYLVTAHHLNDNIETFLINAQRGSGLRGLKSMNVLNTSTNIFRPLLPITKNEIYEYANQNNITFREDVSNQKNDYLRNSIRNTIIPHFQENNSNFERKFQVTLENLQNDFDFLDRQLIKEASKIVVYKDNYWEIQDYQTVHPRLLLHCLEPFGFSYTLINSLFLIKESNKEFYSSTHKLLVDRKRILISENTNQLFLSETNEWIVEGLGSYTLFNTRKITITEAFEIDCLDEGNDSAYFDADLLIFPLKIRPWKAGDAFYPLGLNGQKKVSDLFNDVKLSKWDKEKIVVLESKGQIAWVIGVRISEKFKILKNSKKFLKIVTSDM